MTKVYVRRNDQSPMTLTVSEFSTEQLIEGAYQNLILVVL